MPENKEPLIDLPTILKHWKIGEPHHHTEPDSCQATPQDFWGVWSKGPNGQAVYGQSDTREGAIKEVQKNIGKQSKVLKLRDLGILGDVRQRLGAAGEFDKSEDSRIEAMPPNQLVGLWSGWNLGDESWAEDIIKMYEELGGAVKSKG